MARLASLSIARRPLWTQLLAAFDADRIADNGVVDSCQERRSLMRGSRTQIGLPRTETQRNCLVRREFPLPRRRLTKGRRWRATHDSRSDTGQPGAAILQLRFRLARHAPRSCRLTFPVTGARSSAPAKRGGHARVRVDRGVSCHICRAPSQQIARSDFRRLREKRYAKTCRGERA